MVPLPFGTGAFACGPLLHVGDATDEDEARRRLEEALNVATREADALAGV
jgi:hypothetical protein